MCQSKWTPRIKGIRNMPRSSRSPSPRRSERADEYEERKRKRYVILVIVLPSALRYSFQSIVSTDQHRPNPVIVQTHLQLKKDGPVHHRNNLHGEMAQIKSTSICLGYETLIRSVVENERGSWQNECSRSKPQERAVQLQTALRKEL